MLPNEKVVGRFEAEKKRGHPSRASWCKSRFCAPLHEKRLHLRSSRRRRTEVRLRSRASMRQAHRPIYDIDSSSESTGTSGMDVTQEQKKEDKEKEADTLRAELDAAKKKVARLKAEGVIRGCHEEEGAAITSGTGGRPEEGRRETGCQEEGGGSLTGAPGGTPEKSSPEEGRRGRGGRAEAKGDLAQRPGGSQERGRREPDCEEKACGCLLHGAAGA